MADLLERCSAMMVAKSSRKSDIKDKEVWKTFFKQDYFFQEFVRLHVFVYLPPKDTVLKKGKKLFMVRQCEEEKIFVLVEPDDALFSKYHSFAETLQEDGANEELLRNITLNFFGDFPEYEMFINEHWDGMALFVIRSLGIGVILACMEKESDKEESREDLLNRLKECTPDSVSELKDHVADLKEKDTAISEEKSPVLTVFHFSNLERLIQGISQTRGLSGDIYEASDGFLLPVVIINKTDDHECLRLAEFTDYNRVEEKTFLLFLQEYGKKLCTVSDIRKLIAWEGNKSC